MAEIRFRGERRLGELMAVQRDAGLLNRGHPEFRNGSDGDPLGKPITLAEAGIDKNLADRARKFAAIPDDDFLHVHQWRTCDYPTGDEPAGPLCCRSASETTEGDQSAYVNWRTLNAAANVFICLHSNGVPVVRNVDIC